MNAENLTEIGRLRKAHGLHGKMKANFDLFYSNDLPKLTVLVLKKGDDHLPFFIEDLELNSNFSIVKFESINSKEEATALNGKIIYALTDQLSEVKVDDSDTLLGLILKDKNGNEVGEIIEIDEMPTQLLLKVSFHEKEVLIPFHTNMLIKQSDSYLQLEIAEGLLEI